MKIAVTAANGGLGNEVVRNLNNKVGSKNVIALMRDVKNGADLKELGNEVRQADYDDIVSLKKSIIGIDTLLLISTTELDDDKRIKQHLNVINAAKKGGVKFIVYTSGIGVDESFGNIAHYKTEENIKSSGIEYTILRNGLYLDISIGDLPGALQTNELATNVDDAKFSFVLRSDLAAATANVLSDKTIARNKTYNLSGELITYSELKDALSKALNKNLSLKNLSDEEYENLLKEYGYPTIVAEFMTSINKRIREGKYEIDNEDLEKLLKRKETPLDEAIRQVIEYTLELMSYS